jgi:hypothetical protein
MAEDLDRISSALEHQEPDQESQSSTARPAAVVGSTEAAPRPKTAEGRALTKVVEIKPYDWPVGGWGSLKSVAWHLYQEKVSIRGNLALWKQNKPDGFMCVSCAWAKPRDHYP